MYHIILCVVCTYYINFTIFTYRNLNKFIERSVVIDAEVEIKEEVVDISAERVNKVDVVMLLHRCNQMANVLGFLDNVHIAQLACASKFVYTTYRDELHAARERQCDPKGFEKIWHCTDAKFLIVKKLFEGYLPRPYTDRAWGTMKDMFHVRSTNKSCARNASLWIDTRVFDAMW